MNNDLKIPVDSGLKVSPAGTNVSTVSRSSAGSVPTGRTGSPSANPQLDVASSGTPQELLAVRAEIEQYKDNPYVYELLINAYNTYASQVFSPNLGQQFGEALGDYSSRTNFVNQQVAGLRQEIAEILKANHIEYLSSASAESADMSKAGINVDLSGGQGISPAEGSDIDNSDLANPIVNTGETPAVDFVSNVLQGCMNVFSSTMSFVGNLKQFELQNLQIASDELNNLTNADTWLNQMLKRTIKYNFDGASSDVNSGAWHNALQDAFVSITESPEFNHLSRRTRKAVKTVLSNYDVDNVTSKVLYEQMKNEFLTARQKNVEIQSSHTFSEFLSDWISNSRPYMDQFYQAQMKEFEAKQKQPDLVQSEIAKNKSSERQQNASAVMTEYRKQKVETIGTLFDGIKNAIPNDAWYKGLAEWFTEMSRIMTIQALIKE